MAIRLAATVTCDGCGAQNHIADSNIHARNAAMVARHEGWRIDVHGRDLCPACADLAEHPEKQLAFGAPTTLRNGDTLVVTETVLLL